MRSDQQMGLTYQARKFLQLNVSVQTCVEEVVRVYPDGRREQQSNRPVFEPVTTKEPSGEVYEGMFGDKYPLFKYKLTDGRVYYEYVQADPWFSGPCFFLALKDFKKEIVPQSLWSKEEMDLSR